MGGVVSPYSLGGLALQATTGPAGYALVNGTGTVISWTAPNDGNMHRFLVTASQHVTSAETGGQMKITLTTPDGYTNGSITLYNGGSGTGFAPPSQVPVGLIEAGTAVIVTQTSALASGAAVLWAEIWGS